MGQVLLQEGQRITGQPTPQLVQASQSGLRLAGVPQGFHHPEHPAGLLHYEQPVCQVINGACMLQGLCATGCCIGSGVDLFKGWATAHALVHKLPALRAGLASERPRLVGGRALQVAGF